MKLLVLGHTENYKELVADAIKIPPLDKIFTNTRFIDDVVLPFAPSANFVVQWPFVPGKNAYIVDQILKANKDKIDKSCQRLLIVTNVPLGYETTITIPEHEIPKIIMTTKRRIIKHTSHELILEGDLEGCSGWGDEDTGIAICSIYSWNDGTPLIAHELSHTVGLGHCSERCIMNGSIDSHLYSEFCNIHYRELKERVLT